MPQLPLFTGRTGATFSPCRRYRYTLWRRWADGPAELWLMLNPSTADETANDPTVERCERRARATYRFGGLVVCNIFALRSTDPAALYRDPDPIGPANDASIRAEAQQAGRIVCAWGVHGALGDRGRRVRELLADYDLHHLALTKDGHPRHPLYVGYATQPTIWSP